ncbi:DUF418 domain-containing protein [Colwellia sp. MB02u-6]|jgi:uncharacterized membrane protein YeiB|uniref:DUF418 domain-containing protein n=1 Tax=Colwellia sp. MB02u-6 TaxID=2759824 RepID=UPI002174D748|nr:DUF418 domain-containing protein [Colwellia sp. MB02u-6]
MSSIQANVPESIVSPSPTIKSLAPIAISERIDAMDILRGLALIGILLMNIEWFNRAINSLGSQDTRLTGLDHAVGWLIRCFVEGKFYMLFALLFGMGFAVMLIRAKAAKRPIGAWFSRRMLILMIFGFLHMVFLWGGDILHDYAFAGLLLLGWLTLLKKPLFKPYDNPTSFLTLALVWLSVPILLAVITGIGFGLSHSTEDLTAQWHEQIKVAERVEAIDLTQATSAQQHSEALTTTNALIAARTIPDIKRDINSSNLPSDPSSNLGLATASAPVKPTTAITDSVKAALELSPQALRELKAQAIVAQQREMQAAVLEENKVFTEGNYWQATEFRLNFAFFMLTFTLPFAFTMLLPIFILGYWLVSSSIMKHYQEHALAFKIMAYLGLGLGTVLEVAGLLVAQHPVANQVMLLQVVGEKLFFIGQFVMTAGYFGLIMALLTAQKWRKRLAIFIPMGRMALTNYIMHSVILSSIFYGYAGGYFGEISRAPQMLIAFAIVVLQLWFSRWWLNQYAFGPLEWLWRCLSYKKIQTMRL